MAADTFTYTMKNLDRELWENFKILAAHKRMSVRDLIHIALHEAYRIEFKKGAKGSK